MNYNQGDVTLSAPGLHQTKAYHIWAMGVGAVIAGDFFGWQSSLVGGFLGKSSLKIYLTKRVAKRHFFQYNQAKKIIY